LAKSKLLDVWEEFDRDAPIKPSSLSEFMLEFSNSVSRERLFTQRLLFDLKVAAAIANYPLQTYQAEVDRDGHDIVLEDELRTINLQLKTLFSRNTKTWKIRKRLLRPEAVYLEGFGFPVEKGLSQFQLQEFEGLQGGVVLIELNIEDGLLTNVDYLYCDIFVMYAIDAALVPNKKTSHVTGRLKNELRTGPGSEPIKLPKTLFLRAAGTEQLLALAGLTSRYSSSWRLNVLRYITLQEDARIPQAEKQGDLDWYADDVRYNLLQLIR